MLSNEKARPSPQENTSRRSAAMAAAAGATAAGSATQHRSVSKEELAQHKTKKDCWIVRCYSELRLARTHHLSSWQALHGKVYDVSRFHDKHPGEGINDQYIAMYAGTDVTVRKSTRLH